MRTPLCDLLGIEHPVLQAPTGWAAGPALAAAVSNAGGLGIVALTGCGAEVPERVRRTRALTARPFAANFLLAYDVAAEIDVALDAGVRIISLFWGDPAPFVARVHAAGALLMMSVGSVAEARHAADVGADVIVAQGWDAGGHVRGTTGTLSLTPAVVDAVAPLPVVAAGGIADGRGLAAALVLGAQGAWIGTRFLAATECEAHPDYRASILAAGTDDTACNELFDGGWPDAPGRVLRTPMVAAWEAAGRPPAGSRAGEGEVIGRDGSAPIQRYEALTPRAGMVGDIAAMPHWAGQGVGLVRREQTAREIVAELVAEADAAIRACPSL